jgi:hypothetical protein
MKSTGDEYWQTFVISGVTYNPTGTTINGNLIESLTQSTNSYIYLGFRDKALTV